jgi:hypothetical protein
VSFEMFLANVTETSSSPLGDSSSTVTFDAGWSSSSAHRDAASGTTHHAAPAAGVARPMPHAAEPLPEPYPDWCCVPAAWSKHWWPMHVYGFAVAFSIGAIASFALTVNCFRHRLRRNQWPALTAVNASVGVTCAVTAAMLSIDAYHSVGLLPVPVFQLIRGLPFPVVVATLTVLDRIFSALVRPRPASGDDSMYNN